MPKRIRKRSNQIARTRYKDRIVLRLVFQRLVVLVLVRILLAQRFLLEDLDRDIAYGIEFWGEDWISLVGYITEDRITYGLPKVQAQRH